MSSFSFAVDNWWNQNANSRAPINIPTPHSDLNVNNTLSIRNQNLSVMGCTDNNSIGVVWQNAGVETEIDADIHGSCATQDVNIFFPVKFGIPSATSFTSTDTNGYYIYMLTSPSSTPPRNFENVYEFYDNFDDGSVVDWTLTEDCTPDGTFAASTDQFISGPYSGKLVTPNACDINVKLDTGLTRRWDVSGYIRKATTTGAQMGYYGASGDVEGGFRNDDVHFHLAVTPTGVNGATTADANTWYAIEIVTTDTNASMFVWNSSFTSFITRINNTADPVFNPSALITMGTTAAKTFYVDNFAMWSHADINLTRGLTEINLGDESVSYSNYVTYLGKNYVKTLNYDVNYTCNTGQSGNISLRVNAVDVQSNTPTCNNVSQLLSTSYTRNIDGNTTVDLNFTIGTDSNFLSPIQMTWDYTAPVVEQFDVNIMGTSTYGLAMRCTDSFSPVIDYNAFSNSTRLFSEIDANNFTKYDNNKNFPNFGINMFSATCTDLVSNTGTRDSNSIFFLQVKIPKDIVTGVNITPFSITSTDLNISLSGLVADTNIAAITNLSSVNVTIDGNTSLYFSSNYAIDVNQNTPLQPYLTPISSGISMTLITQTGARDPIQGMRIDVFKTIGLNTVLIQSATTDVTGSAIVFLEEGVSYGLKFYLSGVLLFDTNSFVPTVSPTYFYFNLGTTGTIPPVSSGMKVIFNPATSTIYTGVTSLAQSVSGTDLNYVIVKFYQYTNGTDKNFLVSKSQNCNEACVVTTLISSIPFDVNKALHVDVNAYTDANANVSQFYHVYGVSSSSSIPQLFINARRAFGCTTNPFLPCPWSTIASILIVLLILGAIVLKVGYVSGAGMGILALLMLGFLAYIGWFYWVVYVLAIFVILLGVVSRSVTS